MTEAHMAEAGGIDRGEAPEATSTSDEEFLIAATRSFLVEIAPDEVDIFDADPGFYVAAPVTSSGQRDEPLEFGIEVMMLLAPFIARGVAAAATLVVDALVAGARAETSATAARWVKRLFRGERVEKAAIPADLPRRVHSVVLQTCLDLGLPESDSALVSDVVAGRLAAAG